MQRAQEAGEASVAFFQYALKVDTAVLVWAARALADPAETRWIGLWLHLPRLCNLPTASRACPGLGLTYDTAIEAGIFLLYWVRLRA